MDIDTLEQLVTASLNAEPEFFLEEAARILDDNPIWETSEDTLVPYIGTVLKLAMCKGISITCQAIRDSGITLNQRGREK